MGLNRDILNKHKKAVQMTAAVLFAALVWCLIAFTPLKTTIPGYPDAKSRRAAVRNAILVDSLENTILRWELYAENLDRVLTGRQTLSLDSAVDANRTRYLRRISEEEADKAEARMRAKVREEERFALSGARGGTGDMNGNHFFCPLEGTLSKPYDRVMHPGIDITAPESSVVCATLDGTVIMSGWSDEEGFFLQIQHPDNLVSSYKHNQKILKEAGTPVKAGDPVALAGKYLHFELWHEGKSVNPSDYIKEK